MIKLEIVDTVYSIAYLRPSDPLHTKAMEIMKSLNVKRKISQASLIELDLLMKSRGFNSREKLKTWNLLEKIVSKEMVEPIIPQDFAKAITLVKKYRLDYFDALITAQCIVRMANPITTDQEILKAFTSEIKAL